MRESDSAYRYGGEEFTVILPETDSETARLVADRLLTAISCADFHTADGHVAKMTASFGVAQWQRGEDVNAFLKRSDVAMYESKRKGGNRVTVDGSRGEPVAGTRGRGEESGESGHSATAHAL